MNPEISPVAIAPSVASFARGFAGATYGARTARVVAVEQLALWGWPKESNAAATVALVVAELASNAATHGERPDSRFELRLTVEPVGASTSTVSLRIEVTDGHAGLPPVYPKAPVDTAESGRGLLLVDALAVGRGVQREDQGGKTVWAVVELALTERLGPSLVRNPFANNPTAVGP